jgi:hypothetical protein
MSGMKLSEKDVQLRFSYMGQFPCHGNKAADGNGFGATRLIDLSRSDQPRRFDSQ